MEYQGKNIRLRGRTNTGDGKTDVNSWADTAEEQFSLQEDLAISDRDDVGRNVSRHVSTLSLDDRKSSQGASAKLLAHFRSTLEETRMEIEDITRVRLTARRTTKKKRHLTIRNGLLR